MGEVDPGMGSTDQTTHQQRERKEICAPPDRILPSSELMISSGRDSTLTSPLYLEQRLGRRGRRGSSDTPPCRSCSDSWGSAPTRSRLPPPPPRHLRLRRKMIRRRATAVTNVNLTSSPSY